MFDKLIDFILQQLQNLLPIYIVEEWYATVHLRGGKFYKITYAGVHFKIPFLDNVNTSTLITFKTKEMKPQSIGNQVVRGVVRYKIIDPKQYYLSLAGWDEIVEDTIYQCIYDHRDDFDTEKIKNMSNSVLNKWGIEVDNITLADKGEIRTYRLISNQDFKQ